MQIDTYVKFFGSDPDRALLLIGPLFTQLEKIGAMRLDIPELNVLENTSPKRKTRRSLRGSPKKGAKKTIVAKPITLSSDEESSGEGGGSDSEGH